MYQRHCNISCPFRQTHTGSHTEWWRKLYNCKNLPNNNTYTWLLQLYITMFVLLNRNIEQQRGCTYRNGTLMIKGALLGGSREACAPLLFCSPQGIHTYKKKKCTCLLFPRNSPPRAPLLSRPDGRPWLTILIINYVGTFYMHYNFEFKISILKGFFVSTVFNL